MHRLKVNFLFPMLFKCLCSALHTVFSTTYFTDFFFWLNNEAINRGKKISIIRDSDQIKKLMDFFLLNKPVLCLGFHSFLNGFLLNACL